MQNTQPNSGGLHGIAHSNRELRKDLAFGAVG
jgi:hypothetical protein